MTSAFSVFVSSTDGAEDAEALAVGLDANWDARRCPAVPASAVNDNNGGLWLLLLYLMRPLTHLSKVFPEVSIKPVAPAGTCKKEICNECSVRMRSVLCTHCSVAERCAPGTGRSPDLVCLHHSST